MARFDVGWVHEVFFSLDRRKSTPDRPRKFYYVPQLHMIRNARVHGCFFKVFMKFKLGGWVDFFGEGLSTSVMLHLNEADVCDWK